MLKHLLVVGCRYLMLWASWSYLWGSKYMWGSANTRELQSACTPCKLSNTIEGFWGWVRKQLVNLSVLYSLCNNAYFLMKYKWWLKLYPKIPKIVILLPYLSILLYAQDITFVIVLLSFSFKFSCLCVSIHKK